MVGVESKAGRGLADLLYFGRDMAKTVGKSTNLESKTGVVLVRIARRRSLCKETRAPVDNMLFGIPAC